MDGIYSAIIYDIFQIGVSGIYLVEGSIKAV